MRCGDCDQDRVVALLLPVTLCALMRTNGARRAGLEGAKSACGNRSVTQLRD
jgi:hypothetical protein